MSISYTLSLSYHLGLVRVAQCTVQCRFMTADMNTACARLRCSKRNASILDPPGDVSPSAMNVILVLDVGLLLV